MLDIGLFHRNKDDICIQSFNHEIGSVRKKAIVFVWINIRGGRARLPDIEPNEVPFEFNTFCLDRIER